MVIFFYCYYFLLIKEKTFWSFDKKKPFFYFIDIPTTCKRGNSSNGWQKTPWPGGLRGFSFELEAQDKGKMLPYKKNANFV